MEEPTHNHNGYGVTQAAMKMFISEDGMIVLEKMDGEQTAFTPPQARALSDALLKFADTLDREREGAYASRT
jgi:hypothetical protein